MIVVDDGSRDDTAPRVVALAERDRRVRLLRHRVNRGYGAAISSGLRAARCPHVFLTDADLQFDLTDLGGVVAWAGRADIVVGYRRRRRDPWPRRAQGWVWNRVVDSAFGLGVRDVDCAFKLFDRRIFERVTIRSTGAFASCELLVRAAAAGFRIQEVPVEHHPRRAGRPGGGDLRVVGRACRELARYYPELRRLGR